MKDESINEGEAMSLVETKEYNISKLILPQNFKKLTPVKKYLVNISVRKPTDQEFVRVHSDVENYHLKPAAIVKEKETEESYLILPEFCKGIERHIRPSLLVPVINRKGVIFVWSVLLQYGTRRLDSWNASAHEAVELALKKWIQLERDMDARCYKPVESDEVIPEPNWPDMSFMKIINIAFKGRMVDSDDHDLLKKLSGQA